jgi:hypothetical protein
MVGFQQLSKELLCLIVSFLALDCKLKILDILVKNVDDFIESVVNLGDSKLAKITNCSTFVEFHRLFYIAQKMTFFNISKDAKINWSLYEFDADKIAYKLAHGGELEMLKAWKSKLGHSNTFPVIYAYSGAIVSGNIFILDWLYSIYGLDGNGLASNIIANCANQLKYVEVLEWMIAHGRPLNEWAFINAIDIGDVAIFQWLIDQNCPYNKTIAHKLAYVGNLELFQFLHNLGLSFSNDINTANEIAIHLARNGHLTCLQWWYNIHNRMILIGDILVNPVFTNNVFIVASSHFHILKWLASLPEYHMHYNIPDNECFYQAITQLSNLRNNFDINILNWLFETGHTLDGSLYEYAACYGSIEIFDWLLAHNCEFDDDELIDLISSASSKGYIHILQWLIGHGFELDINQCVNGAVYGCEIGGLGVLNWILFEHEHTWDCREYINELNEELDGDSSLTDTIAKFGMTNILQWLLAKGCVIDMYSCITYAICYGQLDTLKWLVSNIKDFVWNAEHCRDAVKNGYLDILKWAIIDNGFSYDMEECIKYAKRKRYTHILIWLSHL